MPADTTILLVEDNDDLAALYQRYLADTYEVWLAQTGQAALKQATPAVDLILLDYKLPDMLGTDVQEQLRSADLTMPIVLISGTDPDFISLDTEPAAWLTKPFYKEDVQQTILDVLT